MQDLVSIFGNPIRFAQDFCIIQIEYLISAVDLI